MKQHIEEFPMHLQRSFKTMRLPTPAVLLILPAFATDLGCFRFDE